MGKLSCFLGNGPAGGINIQDKKGKSMYLVTPGFSSSSRLCLSPWTVYSYSKEY
jgi:hypothetical protein